MTRKTTSDTNKKTAPKADKEDKPIVCPHIPMYEGKDAYKNFELLSKKIFAAKSAKDE